MRLLLCGYAGKLLYRMMRSYVTFAPYLSMDLNTEVRVRVLYRPW